MKANVDQKYGLPAGIKLDEAEKLTPNDDRAIKPWTELERGVHAALETYANVHRGSGHNSLVSTHLYEQARDIVLAYLGLKKSKYAIIFCTPRSAAALQTKLPAKSYQCLSSQDIGLPLGVRALAVKRAALPKGAPFQTGGGTARLVSSTWVIWAGAPDKFEAGTPAIINVIAFAKALQVIQHAEIQTFPLVSSAKRTAAEILYHGQLDPYSGRELLSLLLQTLIGRNLHVPTAYGDKPYINLDNGASTPTFTPIWDTVCQTWRQPHSVQQEIVAAVKSICANVLGAPLAAYDTIFTANTTEAINLVAESLRQESDPEHETAVLNTLLEHNSNELPWRNPPSLSLIQLPIDADGFIDLIELETLLHAYNQAGQYGTKRIKLVAVSGASNVLGTYNDLAEIARIAHRYGARVLIDAAQLVAHRVIEMEKWEIDYLAFSAHKAYAPFGCGVLMARKGLLYLSPAELVLIQTTGEENTGGIAALGKALLLLQRIGLDVIQHDEQVLTAQVLRGLGQIPGLSMYGMRDPDSPRFAQKGGVIAFGLKGLAPSRVARELAECSGIGVRYGCHCAHLLVKHLLHIHPLLEQFQGLMLTLFTRLVLPGVVRVSLGIENTADDIDTLLSVLSQITQRAKPAMSKTAVKQQLDIFVQAASRRVYASNTADVAFPEMPKPPAVLMPIEHNKLKAYGN